MVALGITLFVIDDAKYVRSLEIQKRTTAENTVLEARTLVWPAGVSIIRTLHMRTFVPFENAPIGPSCM